MLFVLQCLVFSGCVSTTETVEKAGPTEKTAPVEKNGPAEKKDPAPAVAIGIDREAVIKILGRPDYISSFEGQPLFFYCTHSIQDPSQGVCTPVLFEDGKVVAVGRTASQKWPQDTVRFKVEAEREKAREKKKQDAQTVENITVETLGAQKTHSPEQGDRVYVNYYTNFVRYVPLRSTPSQNARILNTLCIGCELHVRSVQKDWLHVTEVDGHFTGWVRKHWVTHNRAVKIAAQKRRNARAPEIARLEAMVKPIPQSKWRENLRLYERLSELDPCNLYYQQKVDFYKNYGRKAQKRKRR